MEWSRLAGKIHGAELRPPEVEKCDQKWGPEMSQNGNFGEKWEVREVKKVEIFRNFRKFTKCSKNAPKVSTSIEKIIWVEISLRKGIFVVNLDHIRWNLGGLEEKIGRSGRRKKSKSLEKKIKITKCPEHAPKVSTSIEKVIWVEISLRKCILGTNLDHIRGTLGGLEVKIGRSGRRKKVKLFENFEKSQNIPKTRQRSQLAQKRSSESKFRSGNVFLGWVWIIYDGIWEVWRYKMGGPGGWKNRSFSKLSKTHQKAPLA